jgi:4-amino-4-deoxy-L-arabinose transferase-like glycosyltransferase
MMKITESDTESLVQPDPIAEPAEVEQGPSVPTWRSWPPWVILAALGIIMVAQLWMSVTQLSITSDEVDHLHAAYRYWQCNDFGWNPEHPPLVKLVAGLPLQAMRINDLLPHACGGQNSKEIDFLAGHQFVFANPESMLTAARFTVSVFSMVLLLATWFFTRKMFGTSTAMIAGVLVAFEPNFLAHGALVTTDVAAALGFLLAIYAAYCYITEPNVTRVVALGLATGFAFSVKHSTILLVVILPVLLIADAVLFCRNDVRRTLLRRLGALVAVAAIALTILWTCYGFRYAARPAGAAIWSPPRLSLAHGAVSTRLIPKLQHWQVLPEAYLVGLQDVLVESEIGRAAFLLGKLYRNGNWFYFPVAATIKFTLAVLLLTVVSACSLAFWMSKRRQLLFLLMPVAIFLAFSMRSKLSIGVRHLLPVLPFLIIFAAAGAWSIARSRKWALLVLGALLALHLGSSLHAFPNYLSYSNELWGGPGETYKYLANSDVDWGQAQKMARAYIEKTHPANCFFLRTYNNKNSDYGIPCGGISEIQWDALQTPYTGTMIVSSSMVDGIGVRGASVQTRRAFAGLKPSAKLGGSALLVYEGTFDLSPIVAAQLLVRAREVGDQDPQAALDLAEKASVLDPLSGDAHAVMCGSYHVLGQMEKAEEECNLGLSLIRKDPQYGPQQVKYMETFIANKGLRISDGTNGKFK